MNRMESESIANLLNGKSCSIRVVDIENASKYLMTKNYQPLKIIGAGGFGAIVEAKNVRTNKLVAIKIIYVEQANQIQSCFQEAQMMATIDSNHVIKLEEQFYDKQNHLFFLIAPLYKNGDLYEYMKSHRQMPQIDIIKMFINILKGVRDINKNNIIHGDLKPQNIIINDKGLPLLIDFGLSRKLCPNKSKTQMSGSSAFYSPHEQFFGNLVLQTDYYAAGMILFSLCGFQLSQQQSIDMKNEIFPSVEGSQHQLLLEIALSMMKRDPKMRSTPSDVIQILQGLLEQMQNLLKINILEFTFNNQREMEDDPVPINNLQSSSIPLTASKYKLVIHENNDDLERRPLQVNMNVQTDIQKVYYPDGSSYEGELNNEQRHGQGRFFYPNDSLKYEGEWRENQYSGYGIYYYLDGAKYEGEWRDDRPNGKGSLYYPDGSLKYEGEWKDNYFEGQVSLYFQQGKYIYPDKVMYEGEWRDDQPHGQGKIFNSQGILFESGEWNNGVFLGQ